MTSLAIGLHAALAAALVVSPGSKDGDALSWAFRFASAIVSDPKDMGKAQEAVVWDYATLGRWADAKAAADRVEGWRRGTAYADLATALAKAGRKKEARELIAKAEAFRPTVDGWQNPRIAAHIANAYAALGEVDKASTLAGAVAAEDVQQYAGRAAATKASSLAATGNVEGAEAALATLDGRSDLEDAWWRTVGHVEIARQDGLPRERRSAALGEARRTADAIPGWKRAEALESISEEFLKLGEQAAAKEAVDQAAAILAPLADTMPIKAPLLANCARAYAKLGDKAAAKKLLEGAERVAGTVQPIDRPAVYANTAATYVSAGDAARGRLLFAKALDEAETLVNARPRALAVVEVCRSMAKSGVPIDAPTRERLGGIYAGLKDPW